MNILKLSVLLNLHGAFTKIFRARCREEKSLRRGIFFVEAKGWEKAFKKMLNLQLVPNKFSIKNRCFHFEVKIASQPISRLVILDVDKIFVDPSSQSWRKKFPTSCYEFLWICFMIYCLFFHLKIMFSRSILHRLFLCEIPLCLRS